MMMRVVAVILSAAFMAGPAPEPEDASACYWMIGPERAVRIISTQMRGSPPDWLLVTFESRLELLGGDERSVLCEFRAVWEVARVLADDRAVKELTLVAYNPEDKQLTDLTLRRAHDDSWRTDAFGELDCTDVVVGLPHAHPLGDARLCHMSAPPKGGELRP